MTSEPITPQSLEQAQALLQRLRDQIGLAFVGQPDVVTQTLCAMLAGGHALIEGVPGLGKTLLVRAIAKSFAGSYARIQFTPDLMPADVTGHTLYDASTGLFKTRRGPVFANIVLADEINRAPAKTQSSLLEVMQEAQVTIEGESHRLEPPFFVLATQNPIEQEGTYALPEAQLDRFLLKIEIGYPSLDEELAIVQQVTSGQTADQLNVEPVQTVLAASTVIALQSLAARVLVEPQVLDYAVRVVRATRDWPGIASGAGTRGALSIVRTARVLALLAARDHVTPDDIKQMAVPALRHRITLTPDFTLEQRGVDAVLDSLLKRVDAPRV
ncbi:MoxR family ATPase [soil metagenome]